MMINQLTFGKSLTFPQSPHTHLSLHSSSSPRSEVRRYLHHHDRALPPRIARLRIRPVRTLPCVSGVRPLSFPTPILPLIVGQANPAPHSQSDLETHLSRILETSLRRSQALSTESLCLVAGQKVWSLRADIHVLDYDGGLIDACCLSTLTALRHYRIPDTSIKGGELTVYTPLERDPVPLALLHHPFCVTLNLFESGEKWLVDATLTEQQCSEGEVVVAANPQGEVCLVQKGGGGEVDALVLLRCVEVAMWKVRELGKVVDGALDRDAKRRDKGGIMSRELRAENER